MRSAGWRSTSRWKASSESLDVDLTHDPGRIDRVVDAARRDLVLQPHRSLAGRQGIIAIFGVVRCFFCHQCGCVRRAGRPAGQQVEHGVRQLVDRGTSEQHRDGQFDLEAGLDTALQLDGHDRVETEMVELLVGVIRRIGEIEHARQYLSGPHR